MTRMSPERRLADLCKCGEPFAFHGTAPPHTIGAGRKSKGCAGFRLASPPNRKRRAVRK